MENQTPQKELGQLRVRVQRLINDVYIWTTVACESLESFSQDPEAMARVEFRVPSRRPDKLVSRTPDQVAKFFHSAAERDLLASIFVFLVAELESFTISACKLVLRSDPRRLRTPVPGLDRPNRIGISEIINSRSLDDLVYRVIELDLQRVSYARPAAFFEYLDRVVGVPLKKDLREKWAEMKATRDALVHNSGIVNEAYVDKAGDRKRAAVGELLPFDSSYFEHSVAEMKSIVGKLETGARKSVTFKERGNR